MKMSKGKQILFVIALLSANIAIMGDNVLYPVIADIYGTYYDHISLVNYVVSGPLLIIFIVSLFVSRLFRFMSKKTIMVLGGILFAVSSIFGVAVDSIYYMAVMRTFYGIGIALINVSAIALIPEVYQDESKISWMMGIFNGTMAVFGAAAGLMSGVLAVDSWKGAYHYYLISVVMVILFAVFLPNIRPETGCRAQTEKSGKEKKQPYGFQFWVMIITVALVTMCFNMGANFVSTYVSEHNLGNSAVSGTVSACATFGSMICCVAFGGLYKKLKKHLLTLAGIMLSAALALLYFTSSLPVTVIAFILTGGAYGLAFTFSYTQGGVLAPERVDDAIGVATAAYAIAGFLSTYAVTGLMSVMNTELFTPILIVPFVGVIAAVLFYVFMARKLDE